MRSELQSISDSPKITGQPQDNELFVSKKPSTSYQNTYCQTFGKQTVAGDSDYENLMDQPKITKVNTEFRTEASLPKNPIVQHHNTDFKKLQEKVDRIAEQVQQMMAKFNAKSSDGKKDSAQISIEDRLDRQNSEGNESCCIDMQNGEWTPNLDMVNQPFRIFQRQKTGGRKLSIVQENSSVYELQSSLKIQQPELAEQTDTNQNNIEPETFKIERIQTKKQKNFHFKITHQHQSQWLAITPINIPQFNQENVFRHKIKVTNSKNNFIFYGLVDRSKISEKSYWKREGTVGCFLYSSKVYYNGEQLPKSLTMHKSKYQTLATNGQIVQIRTNKIFKQISWFVDGYKKLYYKFPLIFSRYNEQKDLVPFVQLFEQGDSIEFISEVF